MRDSDLIRARLTGERRFPIENLNTTATTSGAAQTLITAPEAETISITQMSVTNKSGSAATLTLNAVPSGGTIADTNKEIDALSVAANTAVQLETLIGGMYAAGTVLKVYSGTNGALNIRGAVSAFS